MRRLSKSNGFEYVDVEPCPSWLQCLHGALITSYLGKNSPMRYNIVQNHVKEKPIKKATIGLFVIEHYKTGMSRKELLALLMGIAKENNLSINTNSLKVTVSQYRTYRKSENLPI